MKIIRWAWLTMVLVLSFLSISVLTARGQVRRKSSRLTRAKVKNVTSKWVRVAPGNEGFAVWMPGSPKVGAENLVIEQRPLILSYYSLIQDGTEYAVLSVSGLENEMADLAHILMLNMYSKLIPNASLNVSERYEASIKATYQRDLSLNGYFGREYSIQARNRTGLWRFYTAGKRFYAVVALTTRGNSNLVNRFLHSFTLALPKATVLDTEPVEPRPNPNRQRTLPEPSLSSGRWFIIVGTFSKAERFKAEQRMSFLRGSGYDARILETEYYPNLKKGFLAVAIGPYPKSAAEGVLSKVRSVAPGSYIKSGW